MYETQSLGTFSLETETLVLHCDECGPSAFSGIFFPDGCGSSTEENEEVLDNGFILVGEDYDIKGWDVEGKYEPLEVMIEDLDITNEVSEGDEEECEDIQAGKLSACAEEPFHTQG